MLFLSEHRLFKFSLENKKPVTVCHRSLFQNKNELDNFSAKC